ncbi:MAG TPA: sulfurtransferase [Steroidobacteraceae bacterium]|nr:sulfurtransferase [Steroidobacteraceae bacterium]
MVTTADVAPLITTDGLNSRLGAPGLLIVDCRFDLADAQAGRAAYAAGHIPGAVFAAMEHDLAAPRGAGGRHPLPTPREFAAVLGRWGFTAASQVIAYDQGGGAAAARLWWMLRSRGHRQVQVLDGGWAAWVASGGATETAVAARTPTEVSERSFSGVLDGAQVTAALVARSITLVDARAADRFAGRNESIDPVAGHVPGAVNHPYLQNLGAQQRWLEPAELRQRWAPELGAAVNRPIVMMCGSGITACHNLLALELAGHAGARLYAGSWSEWITDPARPVATGE